MRFNPIFLAVTLAASTALVSSCGSSGTPTTSGVVTGSYFQNAKVCLDSNNNGACDAGEATATTDANGRFQLSGSGAVVADITTGAKRYEPADGSSTDITAANRVVFRAPANANGVVNALTTVIVEDMAASNLSWDAAAKKLADRIGVTISDIAKDHNSLTDATLKGKLEAENNFWLGKLREAVAANASASSVLTKGTIVSSGKGPQSSDTPYLTAINSGVSFASILTTGDAVGGYRMGGIPDGLGAYDNKDNTFTLLMNHELGNTVGIARAHGAKGAYVSEWVIDKRTLEVKSGSDLMKKVYTYDANAKTWAEQAAVAFSRFCSADLPPVSAFYNSATGAGTQNRIFMNGEENDVKVNRGLAHVASGTDKGKSFILPWAGPYQVTTEPGASWENLLAHPNTGDKTVVIGNSDGGANGVYVYAGTKQKTGNDVEKAGLVGGQIYRVSVNNNATETTAADAGFGLVNRTAAFSLVAGTTTGSSFLRPEDGAWDTVNSKRYYFVTTNQMDAAKDGNANSDIPASQVGRTRLWSLTFTDVTRPELGGTIEAVLDGTETVTVNGRAHGPQMFDNITVAPDGTLILLEDVGNNKHNGKVWAYNPTSKQLTLLAQHDEARFGDYFTNVTGTFTKDEETSGVIEVTSILGRNDGKRYFLLVDQNHAAASGVNATELVEGGQLLLMVY
jgi:hypothetical protein